MREIRLASPECKITVSTLGEAEFFADAGFNDILYAVPMSVNKLPRAFALSQRIANFHIMFDHPQHLKDAEVFWKEHKNANLWKWSVFLQIDSGGHRCGIDWEDESSVDFALEVIASPSVKLQGIYTHAGHSYKQSNDEMLQQVVQSEQQCVEHFATKLLEKMKFGSEKEKFIAELVLSIGSTPSLSYNGKGNEISSGQLKVNEWHAGNYVFYDQMQSEIGSCSIDECAAFVLASVISHYPGRNQFLIDCGALGLSKDSGLPVKLENIRPDNEFSWGYVREAPELRILSITQELGVVQVPQSNELSNFPIGSQITIIPHHSCLTAACFPSCSIIQNGKIIDSWLTCPRTCGAMQQQKHFQPIDSVCVRWKEICIQGDLAAVVFGIGKYPENINCLLDAEKNFPLSLCISANHTSIVTKLLEAKANPNLVLVDGNTPLHLAARVNNAKMVSELLLYHANPDVSNSVQELPLHIACKTNNINIIRSLVNAKLEMINYHSISGQTPLSIACETGSYDVVKYLLDSGAHVDGYNTSINDKIQNWKNIPLLVASRRAEFQIVELLIDHKADIVASDNYGYTALHYAAEQGNSEILFLLLNQPTTSISKITKTSHSVLQMSCLSHNYTATYLVLNKMKEILSPEVFSLLIDHQASDGSSALHIAIDLGSLDAVQNLVINGAKISSFRKDGNSPLHIACMKGFDSVVKSFLLAMNVRERSELVNATNAIGSTNLLFAAEEGFLSIVEQLIECNCDLNVQRTLDGATALFMACLEGHSEVVKKLISSGASYSLASPQTGAFPLFIACQQGFESILEILLSIMNQEERKIEINRICFDGTPPLYIAAESGHYNITKLLLSNNANVNHQVDTGSTAIHIASQNGFSAIVRLLLDYNADPTISRNDNISPLFVACAMNQPEIVSLLLSSSSDVHKTINDYCGSCVPLYIASQEGSEEAFAVLIKEKHLRVDLPFLDDSQATPLLAACENGSLYIVQELLNLQANINQTEANTGRSGLLLACSEDHELIVDFLLSKITNENLYNDISFQQETAVSVVSENGSKNSLEKLLPRVTGCDGQVWINIRNFQGRTPLFLACAYKHESLISKLLEKNANPNLPDVHGVSPLFISVQNGDLLIVKKLLVAGANPDCTREKDGIASLHLISLLGHSNELLMCLLDYSASINQQSLFGETPLFVACQENQMKIAKQLLELNADVNLPLNDGTSPLLDACEERNLPVMKLLLEYKADTNQTRNTDKLKPKDFLDNLVL